MTEQPLNQPADAITSDPALIRLMGIAGLFAFGIASLFISFALMDDVSLLSSAPDMVWAFVCGAPSPNGPALPLMLTITTLALLGGVGLTGWHMWASRKQAAAQ